MRKPPSMLASTILSISYYTIGKSKQQIVIQLKLSEISEHQRSLQIWIFMWLNVGVKLVLRSN